MHILVKDFEDLSLNELYDLLELRAEVFVVEQNCVYQDIDGKDRAALHVLGYVGEELVSYTRLFPPGINFEQAAIGRVVVREKFRKDGYGHQILELSIRTINKHFKTDQIKLSAQTYLIKFYEYHGFKTVGKEYLEDGIPHIAMLRTKN